MDGRWEHGEQRKTERLECCQEVREHTYNDVCMLFRVYPPRTRVTIGELKNQIYFSKYLFSI